MSELIASTARLVPYTKRPKHATSFVTAYSYEPAADELGAKLGSLYVVIEVLVSGRASEEVVDLIIQAAGEKYYNEPGVELDALARFEAAVRQTNHELSEYVGRGNAAWIGKLSAVIAVRSSKELHVAQTGSAEAFLYRGRSVSRITQTETARPSLPAKTFGSIATGELEVGDKILFSTPALVHQVPLKKLQTIVTSTGPTTAISELSQLLEGTATGRIAALVIELTTPELAALKVRSDEPEEIQLASNETVADVAIRAAAPIAQTTAETSKKAAAAASDLIGRSAPALKQFGYNAVSVVREKLSTKNGRKRTSIVGAVAVLLILCLIGYNVVQHTSKKQFESYQTLFNQYTQASTQAASGNKSAAQKSLTSISDELKKLGNSNEKKINQQLQNNPLAQGEPTSVAGFQTLVQNDIDRLDGLVKVSPMTVAQIGDKNSKPTHFETDGTKAYVIDAGNNNKISILSLLTGDQKDSVANFSRLGSVVSTTLSPANDGMYILTAAPSVWFYRFATDTLTEQSLAFGSWAKTSAIAAYGSNIYLSDGANVYKHIKNSTGFSPKTDYISTTSSATNSTALAVDGWIYRYTGNKLERYLGTILKQSVVSPESVKSVSNLRSSNDGNILVGTSTTSNRLVLWQASDTALAFNKQLSIDGAKSVYDGVYVPKLGQIFATIDNKLVSFKLQQ